MMSFKDLIYKVPGISFNVEKLIESYKEIIKSKTFDNGEGTVSHIDSIALNRIP